MAEPQSPTYPSARVIADLAREAQLQQLHSIEALDSKAATLIGFGGVLLGLVFSTSIATEHWNRALTVGVSLLAVGISGLLLLLFSRRYRYNPNGGPDPQSGRRVDRGRARLERGAAEVEGTVAEHVCGDGG